MRLSVKTANNEGFKCSQLEGWLFFYHLIEENAIERLQLRLLFLDNNLFENDIEKAFKPSRPGKNLGFLYSWIVKGYCGQWDQGPRVCNFLDNAAMF